LKILAAALKGTAQSGLDNTKIQSLHVVDILSNENLLANLMRYRDIEKRVVKLETKYARLAREKA
jgi:hypothetical protein